MPTISTIPRGCRPRPLILSLALLAAGSAALRATEPAAAEAAALVVEAEARMWELAVEAGRAQWVQQTYITEDTEILSAKAAERYIAATVEFGKAAARFDGLELPADVRRKLQILKSGLTLPAPGEAAEREELTRIAARLDGLYGKGEYCPPGGDSCQDIGELSRILAESRQPSELLEAWTGWHAIALPMRDDYRRFVELANKGARELGFADLGAMWRSNYDLTPAEFEAELARLWGQVRPLYESLHCYVRGRLSRLYGPAVVPPGGPLPAHVLGNMWAQSWSNVYPLVAPPGADPGVDLTALLVAQGEDERAMVRTGESFFTSLGFPPLPESFWQRSLFTKPQDRDVVCHASAWNVDETEDLRIKMCIEITDEDFSTIHHELGHNFYQRAYNRQPYLFRNGANDGFHEGIGDTIALSITPAYLVRLGLLDQEPDASKDLGLLLKRALDKVAFLPFGLLIDQWRWKVFSGEIAPSDYNRAWWDLRREVQGVVPPAPRGEDFFDPGAKYHVPGNTPYTRYFLADILQFQFHRALCAGQPGPLHRCSIYGDREAGSRLIRMLEMGASRPWQDALEALTGQRQMDATAILDYFAPLAAWLDEQNRGETCGW